MSFVLPLSSLLPKIVCHEPHLPLLSALRLTLPPHLANNRCFFKVMSDPGGLQAKTRPLAVAFYRKGGPRAPRGGRKQQFTKTCELTNGPASKREKNHERKQ